MLPLSNVKILDLTTINPFTGTEFSDYGAQVIKVERPGSGDTIRDYPPMQDGVSLYHTYTDRGKKSITLDLKSAQGKEILTHLVADADVLIENFKAGTMEKMGLGYERLAAINPRLVYGKLSSYGSVGPEKDYIAYDIAIQAKAGVMDVTGTPEGEPNRIGAYISDHLSCTYLGSAIAMALYRAKRTGRGQRVEVSMLDAVVATLGERVALCDFAPESASRTGGLTPGQNPCDLFPCRDGWVALAVPDDSGWQAFCAAFDQGAWAASYPTAVLRCTHYAALRSALAALLAPLGKAEMEARCTAAGVPAAAVLTMEEAIHSDQLKARNMLHLTPDQRLGDVLTVGRVIQFDGDSDACPFQTAPLLGQDNEEIYRAYYTEEALDGFRAAGVI